MTENSGDSGFTEFSSVSNEPAQKSDEIVPAELLELSSGSIEVNRPAEKSTSVTTCLQASSSSHYASDDDDSDDDDDDYNVTTDGAKPDILQWVSFRESSKC